VSYRVYRGQLEASADQAARDAAAKDLAHAKLKSKLALLASPESNSYRDTDFEFNQTYVYVVRSVATGAGATPESGDSAPVIVTPKDTFAPAAPQGVVAATLAGTTTGSVVVDLSWSISPENDVAGYRVYRSEHEGVRGEAITPDLVPTPALRDSAVLPGHRYWYSVTAVDRAGNESAASAPTLVETAQPSP
jgi:fibronectin type 3 domain-containing protein